MMKSTIYKLLFTGLICYQGLQAQNVGIGTNTPNASALLDLTSNNQGFLSPRMTLAQKTAIATPATGLLVYQTDGTAGFYYFDGTQWIYLGSGDWKYDGNTVGAVKSIGTNDAFDLPFETNGTERMRLTTGGRLGIGTTTPAANLDITSTDSEIQIKDTDQGSNIAIIAPGATYTGGLGLYTNHDLPLFTNNLDRVTIKANGLVGINTVSPTQRLHVAGGSILTDQAYASSTVSVAANTAAFNTGANPTTQVRITDNASGVANGALTYGATAIEGQYLWITNSDAQSVAFQGFTIPTGKTMGFVYSGAAWREVSANASSAITASNGLNMVGSDVRLGGNLTAATNVTNNTFDLNFAGSTVTTTMDATGFIGIGTTTPLSNLHIYNNIATTALDNFNEYQILLWQNAAAINSYGIGIRPSTMVFNSNSSYNFDVNGVTGVSIIGNNLGVGTATPTSRLDVQTTSGNFYVTDWGVTNIFARLRANNLLQGTQLRFEDPSGNWTDIGRNPAGDFQIEQNDVPHVTVLTGGNVGIGTTAPTQKLHVAGGSVLTDRAYASSTVSVAANTAAFNTGANATTQVRITDNANGAANGALTYGATAIEGQYLWITNSDAQSVAFQGFTIPTGKTMGFVYSGAAWREVSANAASATTASNGLNMVGTDVRLGGNLIAATTVTNNTFDLNFTGTGLTTTFDASGNVGIGTNAPTNPLHIQHNLVGGGIMNSGNGGNAPGYILANNGTEAGTFGLSNGPGNYINGSVNGDLIMRNVSATNSMMFSTGGGAFNSRLTILANGNIGIGTNAATEKLHVSGGSVLTDRAYASSTVSVAANTAAFNTGANATTQVRITDNANGAANGALTYGATAIEGQYLWITNSDAQSVAFQGFTIPTGKTMGFVYSGAAWREVSASQASVADWTLDGNSNGVIRSLGTNDGFDLPFETNGTERMRITTGGNVGIGTATPGLLLDVTGPGFVNGALGIKSQINTWDHIYMNHDGSTANIIAGGADLGLSLRVGLSVTGSYGDASQAYVEGIRILRNGNVGVGISTPTAKFEVQGTANVWSGTKYAVPNGFMAGGSLTIGNTAANYGGGSGWNANTAGLMLETLDNTEIVIHDSGLRLASAMYYESASNRITVGRDMGWGALATTAFVSNVGIGTTTPGQRLSVNGTIQAMDFGGAGSQNIQVGDDAFLTDLDLANVMGFRSQTNTFAHLIVGSTNQGMVTGGTADYVHGAGSQTFGNGGQYLFAASQSVTGSTFAETGGFYADGNSAAIWSPGDGNGGQPAALVYFMDEDSWDGNLNPYDNTALKSYINTAGALVTVSDQNKKNSIKPISNVMDRLKQIGGYEYFFNLAPAEIEKGDKATLQSGVLAQEIKKQFPTAVEESKAGDLYVNYSALIPYLIEATKEQQQVIESLQNKIKEMELKQTKLESELNKGSKN